MRRAARRNHVSKREATMEATVRTSVNCNQTSSVSSGSSASLSPSLISIAKPPSSPLRRLLRLSPPALPTIRPTTMVVPSFFSARVQDNIPFPSTSPSPGRASEEALVVSKAVEDVLGPLGGWRRCEDS